MGLDDELSFERAEVGGADRRAPADQLNTLACAWVGMVCKAVVRADEMAFYCTAPLMTELYFVSLKHGDPGS